MRAAAKPPWSKHYCLFDADLGTCGIAWSDAGLTRFQLPEADRDATEQRLESGQHAPTRAEPPAAVARAVRQLQRYFAGSQVDFSPIAVDLTGIPAFYVKVYEAARRIKWGETATYGELARGSGSPGAARGVGQAMSRNPVPVIIPCHRVLASGNKIGGFSAYGGTLSKTRLLALEGVRLGAVKEKSQLSLFERA